MDELRESLHQVASWLVALGTFWIVWWMSSRLFWWRDE